MLKTLIALSLLVPFLGFSQDLIVKSDATRIFCKITKIDSAYITYRKPPSKTDFMISRKDVSDYRLERPLPTNDGAEGKENVSYRDIVNIGFNAGSSNPVDDFGSQDVNSRESGLAFSGLLLEGTFILKATKYVGLVLNYRYQSNPFNSQAIEDLLEAYFPGSIATCKTEDWKSRGLFAGINLDLPIRTIKNLSVTADLTMGIPQYYYPVMESSLLRNNQKTTVVETSSPVRQISYDFRLGLMYKVHPNVAIYGGCDYFTGEPTFTINTKNNFGYYSTDTYKQKITTVNFKAGIYIILQQKDPLADARKKL